jgi:hypothetical protein
MAFTPPNEEGRRGNDHGMRCRARGSDSMAGRSRWPRRSPALVRKEEEEVGWAKRPNRPAGLPGRLGRKLKKSFLNKNYFFEFTKAFEICTRRFRTNFDVGIFPIFL